MSYTVSFDASLKCKKGDVKGLILHIARDADERQLNHSNPNIDIDFTPENQTFFYNQESDGFEHCKDLKQILQSLDKRLESVKKPLRKDAVVVRPLILQLDPNYYEDTGDSTDKAINAMLNWACDTFGDKNIIGGSVHKDEDAPHLHLLFTPVTEDGRLSQKDWFTNPNELRKMHDDLRSYMQEQGFDIMLDRKKPGKHARRMPEAEYRDFKELQSRASVLDGKERRLDKKSKDLKEREDGLNSREMLQNDRETILRTQEVQLQAEREKLVKTQIEAQKRVSEFMDIISEANTTLNDLKNIKDERIKRYADRMASVDRKFADVLRQEHQANSEREKH